MDCETKNVPSLKTLAPTQSEPPFAVTQLVVLAVFVAYDCSRDSVPSTGELEMTFNRMNFESDNS